MQRGAMAGWRWLKWRDDRSLVAAATVVPNLLPLIARAPWIFSIFALCHVAAAADWQASLTKDPPGKFPPARSLRAKYVFGWSGFTAGTGDIRFNRTADEQRYVIEATGGTVGLARALWRYDVNYHAATDANTLRPIEARQVETQRKKTMTTTLAFNSSGVSRSRTESGKTENEKPKQTNMSNLYDLLSALLYARSQPMKEHSSYRVVVYPTTNAYVATLTVLGREKVSVHAGSYNAIKLGLQLSRVGKNALEPYKKFKRATVWISDDNDRIVLRVEAQIFVGTVYADLQSVQFDAKH